MLKDEIKKYQLKKTKKIESTRSTHQTRESSHKTKIIS